MWWALFVTLTLVPSRGQLEEGRLDRQEVMETCPACGPCTEKACSPCRPRFFLLIWRVGIQQHVTCVHACPSGYFSARGRDVNRCTKCRMPSCDRCFSKDFCMRCREGWYLHQGKCSNTCPTGTAPQLSTRECEECEVRAWSKWTPCSRNGKVCGYKWGTEERIRESRRWSSREEKGVHLIPCQLLLHEERRCRLQRHCPGDRTERRLKGRKEKQRIEERPTGG